LESGLLGREQDERRPFRVFPQRDADFAKTAERLAAAGGAEEKSRLHGEFLTQRHEEAKAQRDFISLFVLRETNIPQFHLLACAFLFLATIFSAQRSGGGKQFICNFWQNPAGREP
jgi:hypothetical protein